MFPVYTLFEAPDLLPMIYTHKAVLQKLQSGADLMAPGLIGPPFSTRAMKGCLVAVGDYQSPTVPIAVGILEMDLSEIQDVRDVKGKAVKILHWVDDELWKLGGDGGNIPDNIEGKNTYIP